MAYYLSEYGFVRVGAVSPELRVGDIAFNTQKIIEAIDIAAKNYCSILLFPELCITGYTSADLFYQSIFLEKAKESISEIARHTRETKTAAIVGAPLSIYNKIYNCAIFISSGNIVGIVPKTYLPNTNEYYEERWFSSEFERTSDEINWDNRRIPFGADLLFEQPNIPNLLIGIEICEDLWSIIPPSLNLAASGATVLLNLSASNEILAKSKYRAELVRSQSARCLAAYVYASAGPGESSTDLVYSGHSMISEYGYMLAQSDRFKFETQIIYADIDLERLNNERIKNSSFSSIKIEKNYKILKFEFEEKEVHSLSRSINPAPFVPSDKIERTENCNEIFSIQTAGLAKRIRHLNFPKCIIGISGGLDSTLALLVAYKTFILQNRNKKDIIAVTMPGFGTTQRTKSNAEKLAAKLGVTLKKIPIKDSVLKHFEDIGHNPNEHDLVFENAQARERTQILMDLANKMNGIVIGTGDLSEIALGWATYNGDHISMYGVNSGIPKTLVKYIIQWCAEVEFDGEASRILLDIINTPISPELLPAGKNGEIIQQTEKSIGPYELHDFFLFYSLRHNFSPHKIVFLAGQAFKDKYTHNEITKWLSVFYRRLFSQQFKRSCMPDGIKVGSVALSPRGDWRMPSDAEMKIWIEDIERLTI